MVGHTMRNKLVLPTGIKLCMECLRTLAMLVSIGFKKHDWLNKDLHVEEYY
jgi:ribosomal protein S14